VFLIVPKEESTGESVMTVQWAKDNRKKWEEINKIRPNFLNAMNLACIYHTLQSQVLGLDGEALRIANLLHEGLKDAPEVSKVMKAQVTFNRGMFLRGYGRMEEAARDIKDAFSVEKFSDFMGMAYAEELLREGNWKEAWEIHNRARGTVEGAAQSLGLKYDCKFWDGVETPDHLMVINEGGTGDRINYTRYLPLLTERGIKWSFFCFDELKPFYDRLPWIGPDRTIGEKDKKEFSPPPTHWTTPFCLAGPLGIDPHHIPDYPTPYTAPKNAFSLENPDGRPVVGLAWNANELWQGGLKCRSLTEGQAMRLVCLTADKVHWVNLQHGHKMPYPVINVPFESWEDTAAVIEHLDSFVTVDSGPLWLSLGMGKDTAVLLSACEDWKFRWNWSPKATLYHNGPSDKFADVECAINQLVLDIRKGIWPKCEKTSTFSLASSSS
jgi:hypothetical protein